MTFDSRNSYWETQVLTATPQKLRLLLIEGALRFAREAIESWQRDQREAGFNAALRCQDILFELLSSVRRDDSEINRAIVGIYVFLVQEIQPAIRNADAKSMQGIAKVLEEEQATWQKVCEQYPHKLEADAADTPAEISARHLDAISPHIFQSSPSHLDHFTPGSLSLDA